MKIAIKKIGVLNVIFSAFPVAVFVVMLIGGIMGTFSPEVAFTVQFLVNMILQAILNTLVFLVLTVFFLFAYNVLCSIGVRAITVELEDKEEN